MAPKKEKNVPVEKTQKPAAAGIWSPFQSLREEIDSLFDSFDPFGSGMRHPLTRLAAERLGGGALSPAMDLVETDGGYRISAELPGIGVKDIDIKLSNGALVIKGEKREVIEDKKEDCLYSERRFGSFSRSMRLPGDVEAGKISAAFANGVLTVDLPKSAEAKKADRKIDIKAA